MKSRGGIAKGARRHRSNFKSITTIAAATLTLLVSIQYIPNYKNIAKLKASFRHSPSSKAVWFTQTNHVSSNSTKSSVQSVYHQYQLLDFLQENLNRGKCGWHKCLFPLKIDPRIGYLVKGDRYAEQVIDAYTASKNIIEDKYGMEHIYLAPPKTMSVSLDFRKWMDMEKTASFTEPDPNFPRFTEEPEVIVQAVAIVPEEDSIMLGTWSYRRQHGLKGIEEMFTPRNNELWNITEVEITVKHDFAALYSLVEDEKDDKLPCLCEDFQIFLLRSGHLVHLDVDRCYEKPDLMRKRCVPDLQELETLVLKRLQKSKQEQQRMMGVISNSSFTPELGNESMV